MQHQPQNVIINYKDLENGQNLDADIQRAYGPKGHGILFVDQIPGFQILRKLTLPIFHNLANLPKESLSTYSRPGWSCGVQQFQGRYDTSKGSYYMNCCTDQPQTICEEDQKKYTTQELKMNVGNIWVKQLPEFQKNVKALSKLMISTGALLTKHIDSYSQKRITTYSKNLLEGIIANGQGHIGRALYYYPFDNKGQSQDDWCGWHNDHGSLTALTSAMYINDQGQQMVLDGKSGGLYAQNRFTQMKRIGIPPSMLAFQLGESAQIHTGGHLQATPHCVVRNEEIAGKKVGRSTFAVFMQPNFLESMKVPQGILAEKVYQGKAYKIPPLQERWENGILFKQFHQRTIKRYS